MSGFDWQGRGGPGPRGAEVNSLFLRMHVEGITQLGVDLDALLARWQVPLSALERMPDWVDRGHSDHLWQAAEELGGDPAIGMRLAHQARGELDELVSSVIRESRDLGDALSQLCQYGKVLDSSLDFCCEHEGDTVVVVQQPESGPPPLRQPTEYVVTMLSLIGRQLTGVPLRAREVHFRHSAPADLAGLRAHLGDELCFDGMYNALVIDRALLALPLRVLDAEAELRLRREADELLRALPDDRFLRRIRKLLAGGLRRGVPGGRELAERLGIPEATLRTRLRLRGTSLRLLLDSVRHTLALRYLQKRNLSVREVALRLGYQDPTTFGRAFRRWVGCSPQEYIVTH